MTDRQLIHVAAAVIKDEKNRILLTRRADHLHQGGLWEFPGGKLEPGEDAEQALIREIKEELGMRVLGNRPLIRTLHHYPEKSVILDVFLVTEYEGAPQALEDQPMAWVIPEELNDYAMPEADIPIINAVRLPASYLITGEYLKDDGCFLETLEAALERGISLVQLRLGNVSQQTVMDLGSESVRLCHQVGARLLLNGESDVALQIGADGVHLNSYRLMQSKERPLTHNHLVAASCHNQDELNHASSLGVDFAVLSPVLPTSSHPDADVLEWDRFAALISDVDMPVYALGGMQQKHLETAWKRGAQGIAGISCFWG